MLDLESQVMVEVSSTPISNCTVSSHRVIEYTD